MNIEQGFLNFEVTNKSKFKIPFSVFDILATKNPTLLNVGLTVTNKAIEETKFRPVPFKGAGHITVRFWVRP